MLHRIPLSVLALAMGVTLEAADWPQWRGPNRDGISQDTGLLQEWPEGRAEAALEAHRHRHRLLDSRRRGRQSLRADDEGQGGVRALPRREDRQGSLDGADRRPLRDSRQRLARHAIVADRGWGSRLLPLLQGTARLLRHRRRQGEVEEGLHQGPGRRRRLEGCELGVLRVGAGGRRPRDLHARRQGRGVRGAQQDDRRGGLEVRAREERQRGVFLVVPVTVGDAKQYVGFLRQRTRRRRRQERQAALEVREDHRPRRRTS